MLDNKLRLYYQLPCVKPNGYNRSIARPMQGINNRATHVEEIQIELPCFDDPDNLALSMLLPVTRLPKTEFVVLEPVFLSRRYLRTGDVIETEQAEGGTYRYVRTVKTTPMRGEAFSVARQQLESEPFRNLLDEVCHNGGAWEFLMEGILYLEMPRGSSFWNDIYERVRTARDR